MKKAVLAIILLQIASVSTCKIKHSITATVNNDRYIAVQHAETPNSYYGGMCFSSFIYPQFTIPYNTGLSTGIITFSPYYNTSIRLNIHINYADLSKINLKNTIFSNNKINAATLIIANSGFKHHNVQWSIHILKHLFKRDNISIRFGSSIIIEFANISKKKTERRLVPESEILTFELTYGERKSLLYCLATSINTQTTKEGYVSHTTEMCVGCSLTGRLVKHISILMHVDIDNPDLFGINLPVHYIVKNVQQFTPILSLQHAVSIKCTNKCMIILSAGLIKHPVTEGKIINKWFKKNLVFLVGHLPYSKPVTDLYMVTNPILNYYFLYINIAMAYTF